MARSSVFAIQTRVRGGDRLFALGIAQTTRGIVIDDHNGRLPIVGDQFFFARPGPHALHQIVEVDINSRTANGKVFAEKTLSTGGIVESFDEELDTISVGIAI